MGKAEGVQMLKEEANHLLEHWIEHNESHSKSFRDRAKQVREISPEAAKAIEEAAEIMDQSTLSLRKAKEVL